MATSCINIKSVEYQTLKKKSGISDFTLSAICRTYMDKYGRFPYLDELNSNSTQYLKDQINLKDNNSAKVKDILDYAKANSIEEANIKINDNHRDLEVTIIPLEKEALVHIDRLPSLYHNDENKDFDASNVNSKAFLQHIISKFSKLYGIKFIPITTAEISAGKVGTQIIDPEYKSAFVYNNNVYINTDIASIDDPIHEMFHIFLGGIRFKNPDLYFNLVNTAENFKGYDRMREHYSFKTQQDLNEEIFVKELARYYTGLSNQITGLSDSIKHEIEYNLYRMLDITLKGNYSSKSLGTDAFQFSLKQLAQLLDSAEMKNEFQTSLGDAQIHRILANRKSELLKSNELKQICK